MTTIIQGDELRNIALGRYTKGKTSTITADATHQIFTVAGGEVLITALWGKVTTAITDAGEDFTLQADPTTGDATTIVASTDLGTTDTAAGTTLGVNTFLADPATSGAAESLIFAKGGRALRDIVVTTGEIELVVGAGSGSEDGVVEWYCTWVPLTDGATLVASA